MLKLNLWKSVVSWCALLAIAVTTSPAQTKYVLLHTFAGGPTDGAGPDGTLIRDSAGNLYGTTFYGGPDGTSQLFSGFGTVYKVDRTGHETVLHGFQGDISDGYWPVAGVIRDSAGNLYGTTLYDTSGFYGNVFKLDVSENYTQACSLSLSGEPQTWAGVIDSAGNLYGTTLYGGAFDSGEVYECAHGHENVLYSFTGGSDGGFPFGGLIRDSAGNLYGTASDSISTLCISGTGYGVVFKLDSSGSETVLYSFTGGADGGTPCSGVIRDSAGNLYGTTKLGGANGGGVVYKLDTSGHETVLHSFTGGADGSEPVAGVIQDKAGNLYGTTYYGGANDEGVVYKLDTSNNETVLYSFCARLSCVDGANPYSGVVRDGAGNLYGTAHFGGKYNLGVVFKLKP